MSEWEIESEWVNVSQTSGVGDVEETEWIMSSLSWMPDSNDWLIVDELVVVCDGERRFESVVALEDAIQIFKGERAQTPDKTQGMMRRLQKTLLCSKWIKKWSEKRFARKDRDSLSNKRIGSSSSHRLSFKPDRELEIEPEPLPRLSNNKGHGMYTVWKRFQSPFEF